MGEEKVNVLLVDDDRLIQKMVSGYLEKIGYKVQIANNGVEAMVKVRERVPSILLTDRNMPAMDGLELVRRLRAAHRTAAMPIIMFSDLGADDDALLGYSSGADEYVPKPFTVQLLAVKIQTLLRRIKATSGPTLHRGRVIVFFHGKGGAGATTLATNSAVALTMDSASTVSLLDINTAFPNAAMYLNVRLEASLAEIEPGKMDQLTDEDFSRFVQTDGYGVRAIEASAGPEQEISPNFHEVMQKTIERLRRANDYVLIDCPPDFSPLNLLALDAADLVCLVTEPTLPAMKATKDCLRIFTGLKIPDDKVTVIFNQTTKTGASEVEASKFLDRKFDFNVPFAEGAAEAANTGFVMVGTPGCPIVESLKSLAEKIRAGVRV